MDLPRKTVRYFQELRSRGLVGRTLRSGLTDVWRFGPGGHIRYGFEVVGVKSRMPVRYPGTNLAFRVRTTPFWKYWKMLEAGAHDLESFRFLSSFVKPGQIVLDVGAWEGPYSLLFGELVGREGSVIAFEPDPKASAILRDNVEASGLANVRVEDLCLSNVEGSALFFDSSGGTIGTLIRNELVGTFRQVAVTTTTLDRYCREHLVRMDGLKVDVEGAEALVVEGARDSIARFSPWMFLEFHGVLMSEAERQKSWASITGPARAMTFVWGKSKRYGAGDPLDGYPDCDYFHVLIQY